MAATGFGMYLAMPILRNAWRADLSESEARSALEDCMRVLYYRDARALNKVVLSKADATGVSVTAPYSLSTEWEYSRFVSPHLY